MTEAELLSFVLERQQVSSSEVAKKFGIRHDHSCQVLRRLEQKGLLEKSTRRYGARYRLTQRAKEMSHRIKEKDGDIGRIFLFGLASVILLLASKDGNDSAGEKPKETKSVF